MKLFFVTLFFAATLFAEGLFYYDGNKKIILMPLEVSTLRGVTNNIRYFSDPSGTRLGIKDKVLITTDIDIQEILEEYNLKLIIQLSKDTYLVQVPNEIQVLEIANKLHKDIRVKNAHPNFIRQIELR